MSNEHEVIVRGEAERQAPADIAALSARLSPLLTELVGASG
jgi:hypothetical protein